MRDDIRMQIITAAIECIEEVGFNKVTVRMIARKADVNCAAINYYFGSKDNLIKEVMDITIEEAFINNLKDFEDLWKRDPRKALYCFLHDTFEGMINFQGITRAHFNEAFVGKTTDSESILKFNQFLENLFRLIREILPDVSPLEKKMSLVQTISAIFLPGIFPGIFEDFLGEDFSNEKLRKSYVSNLVGKIKTQPDKLTRQKGEN